MRRPGPSIMFAIGLPHPQGEGQDDSLQREHDGDDGPTDTLELIYERLKHGDEVAAHTAMSVAHCLQQMTHSATRGDERGLRHWYEECTKLIAHLDGEDQQDDDNG